MDIEVMLRANVTALLFACVAARVGAQTVTPTGSETPAATDPVVASVHRAHEIRQSDVDAWRQRHAPAQFARLRQDLYDSNRQAVDALVGEYLLAEEAAERGTSADALIRQQLDEALLAPIREEDVREMYERSRSMMGAVTFEQARPAIQSYLEETRHNDARQAFIGALRAKADDVVIRLEAPRYDVVLRGDEASFGPPSARLTMVEYSEIGRAHV